MLDSMDKFIRDQRMILPGTTVLCAVSGGADSICLLHALYRLRQQLHVSLAAAHYNHMLRGAESDRDAAFVAQFIALCCGDQHGLDGAIRPAIPLISGSGDVAAQAKAQGTGLEETARQMRYAFLRQAASQTGATLIATAHTADDNLETILFHLARGSGLRGLTGIPPVREDLIRPLLTTTRQEVEAYLTYHGLPHVDDHTNADLTYTRNRIRHKIIPVLEDICPGFTARVADTTALLRADEDYLTAQASALTDQAQRQTQQLSIPAALIGDQPDPVAARAVRQLIGQLNGGDQDCAAVHLGAVVGLCRGSNPSAQIHLPYGLTARREYEQLILTRAPAPTSFEAGSLTLPGEHLAGGWRLISEPALYEGQKQGPWDFWLTRKHTFTLRPRRIGDALKLSGRPGKTVKKWCIDEKIPAHLRASLPLLDWDGQVAAVAGLGPAETFLPKTGDAAWHIKIQPIEPKEIIWKGRNAEC